MILACFIYGLKGYSWNSKIELLNETTRCVANIEPLYKNFYKLKEVRNEFIRTVLVNCSKLNSGCIEEVYMHEKTGLILFIDFHLSKSH